MLKKNLKSKTVYLTFDDGIENGTMEVLNVLEKKSVTATFFATGINTYYSYLRDKQLCQKALLEILRHHSLGNHSYSHANGFYSSYYQKGLLIDNNGTRIAVKDDFLKNENFLMDMINENKEFIAGAGSRFFKIARLPGRNTWYVSHRQGIFEKIDGDSFNAARELFNAQYQVIGWDEEWRMNFDFAADSMRLKNELIKNGSMDYTNPEHTHPYFDMNASENIHKDRLTQPWTEVGQRIMQSSLGHIVVLLHDRAFRSNSLRNESYKLELLIQFLQEEGIVFKSLDGYSKLPAAT